MGKEQSVLSKNGYVLEKETEKSVVAKKGFDQFIIKKIILDQTPRDAVLALTSEIEILKTTNHPHIVSMKNSFKDKNTYYVVMDYCQGGNLATKIRAMNQPPQEFMVLSWIVEICMALGTIHERGLLHKSLTPEGIFLTESGILCLGEFGKIYEKLRNTESTTNSNQVEKMYYLAPEVFAKGTYDAKSDMWSLGCLLYELCTRKSAFSADTTVNLIPKILGGPYPSLPDHFSSDLRKLLNDLLNKDPQSRPTADEVLEHPFIINCLSEKCKSTVDELQTNLKKLWDLADGLERVHAGTTIGSLAGGVIGVMGGITSIVGLILAPFTLGASLIVTGVGVGVGAVGGITAGASNITKMVNESSDRKAVQSIIKYFEQNISAVVTWLQVIRKSLQTIERRCNLPDNPDTMDSQLNESDLINIGCRAGKGLGGIAELVRLAQVMNIGKIVAQTSRVVRVAEVATGVLSGLFVAMDIFFIAMDAKEIHHIRQAKAANDGGTTGSQSVSETETNDSVSTSDQAELVSSSLMAEQESESGRSGEQEPEQSSQETTQIRSEIMKFVRSIRQAAHNLQKVLDELKIIISSITSPGDERKQEWRDMELM